MRINLLLALFVLSVVFVAGCTAAVEESAEQVSVPADDEPAAAAAVPAPGVDDVKETVVVGEETAPEKAAEVTTGSPEAAAAEPQKHTVEITASGYEPKSLTIKAGDTVTWVNTVSQLNWPASAVHPTHRVYPGSDISKCSGLERTNIFDACRGIGLGAEYSFTFTETGKWFYHNHLQPSQTGSIVVE